MRTRILAFFVFYSCLCTTLVFVMHARSYRYSYSAIWSGKHSAGAIELARGHIELVWAGREVDAQLVPRGLHFGWGPPHDIAVNGWGFGVTKEWIKGTPVASISFPHWLLYPPTLVMPLGCLAIGLYRRFRLAQESAAAEQSLVLREIRIIPALCEACSYPLVAGEFSCDECGAPVDPCMPEPPQATPATISVPAEVPVAEPALA